MKIPSYQIRNILESYAKLLCEGKKATGDRFPGEAKVSGNYKFDAEGKRRMVVQKVVHEIIEKITDVDRQYRPGHCRMKEAARVERKELAEEGCEFTYYRMERDDLQTKSLCRLDM